MVTPFSGGMGENNTDMGTCLGVAKRPELAVLSKVVRATSSEKKKYHTYLTNIETNQLDLEDIVRLYAARWEIELIFKELKSRYAIDKVKTKNPQIIEAMIWVGFLTMLASRVIYSLVRTYVESQGKSLVRYTQMRWSKIFLEQASRHLTKVLKLCGFQESYELLMDVYTSQALDPHVERKRLRDGLWS